MKEVVESLIIFFVYSGIIPSFLKKVKFTNSGGHHGFRFGGKKGNCR